MNEQINIKTVGNEAVIQRLFRLQQKHHYRIARSTFRERRSKLKALHDAILRYRQDFRDAMWKDFRKPAAEVDLSEIYTVTSEIKHVRKYLKSWMRPQAVHNPISMIGTRSYIRYEPKGVVLVMAPWNYPINLILAPLITAIAAGNCVILKPSENVPHTSKVLAKLIAELFDEQEVALIEGGVETAEALLRLPFNHIFFTGSPAIGKLVMQAAAKHLTSVTLELGGKTPVIIDDTADMPNAVRRIVWGKFLNGGQTCIAPDYLWIHHSRKEAFLKAVKEELSKFYGASIRDTKDFARIVNQKHYERLKATFDEAIQRGATIAIGGKFEDAQQYISPTVLLDVDPDSDLMQDEIFGPILPMFTFSKIEEPLRMIQSKPKALALYIFSKRQATIDQVMSETRAGTTCVNHVAVQFGHHNLPFGGVNNSGIGKSHGIYGFQEFSNARGILRQRFPISLSDFLTAPYTKTKQKLIDLAIKWF